MAPVRVAAVTAVLVECEEEEEKDRKLYSRQPDPADEPSTLGDLMKCVLTRDSLAKYCMNPWFEDYVKGEYCNGPHITC